MITLAIPGRKTIQISHIALDFNGTIAFDGTVQPEVATQIRQLSQAVSVVVLTADTYGTARRQCAELGVDVRAFTGEAASEKRAIVASLDGKVACVGNGFNDIAMCDAADFSVGVLDGEGMCPELLNHVDVLARSSAEALALFLNTDRLRATLRP
ncbi:MAG: ATPase P [Atopobiaceae bacterium]|jgi:P-type E1-E2 ATPase